MWIFPESKSRKQKINNVCTLTRKIVLTNRQKTILYGKWIKKFHENRLIKEYTVSPHGINQYTNMGHRIV